MRTHVLPLYLDAGREGPVRPVPVLMYHHVNPHKDDMVTVTPEVFERQMHYLHKSGYGTLTVDELISYIAGEKALKQKAVVVTFDDGWLDNYIYAFPILKRYNIKACIFIVTDWVGNSGQDLPPAVPTHRDSKSLIKNGRAADVILSWDHIREMRDSGLVEFYAHTKTHPRCTDLPENELLYEMREPKQAIENHLAGPCPYLCWPYGRHNDATVKAARAAGYKALFTTTPGVVCPGSDPFAIKRIVVKDRVGWFKKRMAVYTNSFLATCYLKIKKK